MLLRLCYNDAHDLVFVVEVRGAFPLYLLLSLAKS